MSIRNLAESVRNDGHNILDTTSASPLYNDNESCVKWLHNMTTQQLWHMEMWENAVCEWVQDAFLKILHVSGCINPADIFAKEMWDGGHFWHLRDSFMCPLTDFCQQSLLEIHLSHQHVELQLQQVLPSAASPSTFFSRSLYLLTMCSFPLSWTLVAISHLSSAGCHIICLQLPVVPFILIWVRGIESTQVGFFFLFVLDAWIGGVCLSLIR